MMHVQLYKWSEALPHSIYITQLPSVCHARLFWQGRI